MNAVIGTDRARLATAAHDFVRAGWPVAPGTWWSAQQRRYRCGRPRCRISSPHPVDPGLAPDRCRAAARRCRITNPADLDRWWVRHPYALLLPTGVQIGVVDGLRTVVGEVDERLRADGYHAPLASPVNGQLQLYCAPLDPGIDLWVAAAAAGVLVHGEGSWVTLPPSVIRTGGVRWVRHPAEVGWRLPPADVVARTLGAILDRRLDTDRRFDTDRRPVVSGKPVNGHPE